MSQREKLLAVLVGLTLLVLGGQFGFNKYRTAIQQRETQLKQIEDRIFTSETRQLEGAMADAKMSDFVARSLPGDKERATAVYNRFLGDLLSDIRLSNVSAKPGTTIENPLYYQLTFSVSGSGNLEQIGELLFKLHEQDCLHRIKSISVQRIRQQLSLNMTIEALALKAKSADVGMPAGKSSRVAIDMDAYLMPILNRNPMSPPNQQPQYAADRRIEAVAGQDFSYMARFNDPDAEQKLNYEVEGELPEGLRLDPSSGQLRGRFDGTGRRELTLLVTDNGWPRLSQKQDIVIEVVEPPAEEVRPEPPKFNEATQAYLTGLTQSRGDWTAMVHIRTRGETLKLKVGDSFEIGQLKGTVVEVNNKYAVLESEGERFELKYEVSLADAYDSAAP